jgi:hypothetical protein
MPHLRASTCSLLRPCLVRSQVSVQDRVTACFVDRRCGITAFVMFSRIIRKRLSIGRLLLNFIQAL